MFIDYIFIVIDRVKLNRVERPDKKPDHITNLIVLITFIIIALTFSIYFVLNLFIFRNKKAHIIMNCISYSGTLVAFLTSIIVLMATSDVFVFNKEYINIYITSCLTLLGFGLTIAAILSPILIKRISKKSKEKQIDSVLTYLVPYFATFTFGLANSIAMILDLQFIESGFYQITVFKALLFSVVQIVMLIVQVIFGVVSVVTVDKTVDSNN